MKEPVGSKPAFIIDTETMPERGYDCTTQIERGIYATPEIYAAALGGIALYEQPVHEPEVRTKRSTSRKADATKILAARLLIDEYLENNYGKNLEFDEETEAALDEDATYRQLRQTLAAQKTLTLKSGNFTVRRPHPEAENTRKKVNEHILGLFVQRVFTWQKEQAAKTSELPKAS